MNTLPKLPKLRTSKGNIKTLLKATQYKTLKEFMNDNPELNEKESLEFLLENYNSIVDEINKHSLERQNKIKEQIKQKTKQNKSTLKALSQLPAEEPTQRTRQQRQEAYEKYKTIVNRVVNDKPTHKRKELKALKGIFQEIIYDIKQDKNIDNKDLKNILLTELSKAFNDKQSDRNMNVNIIVRYRKIKDGKEPIILGYTGNYAETIKSIKYINDFVNNYIKQFETYIDDNNKGESGYVFDCILGFNIQISFTKIPKTGSYIPTPKVIADKKCCVNIKNENDDKCLLWCMLAFKHYEDIGKKENRTNPKYYEPYLPEIVEPENIIYPISIDKDIPKFEKLNNIKINVFTYEDNKVNVLYNTRDRTSTIVIDLLLIKEGDKQHFLLIRDFSRFMRTKDYTHGKMNYCRYCLNACFDTVDKLESHINDCISYEAVRAVLPTEEDNKMVFKGQQNTFKHPFYITADFEATLIPYNDDMSNNTIKYQEHKPNSFGLKFECIYPEYSRDVIIVNNENEEELMKSFVETCEELTQYAYSLTQKNKKFDFNMGWNMYEKLEHNKLVNCQLCNTVFDNDKNKKVVHHDHITGKYLSTICSKCNLDLKYKRFVPIYLHNLKSYDSHFIVPYLAKYGQTNLPNENISCIPNNEEKYISFSKKIGVDEYKSSKSAWTQHIKNCCKDDNQDFKTSVKNINYLAKCKELYVPGEVETKVIYYEMRYLDTIAFMSSSLEGLADNLKKDCKNVIEMRNVFKSLSQQFPNDEQFLLMCEKGIYPYEYITDYKVLTDDKLPAINKFYSKLNKEHCKEEDYRRAVNVWNKFNCKTLMDYHNLYLTSDVLLLSDIWSNFREVCYKIYGLDPCYYYTAPSLSWDAMMKYCNETIDNFYIELLTDMDMYLLFEKSIRGGLSQISKRYAKANNKYIPNYNPNDLSSFILYLDANNLYGGGMSSYLPYKNFKWNNQNWTTEKILSLKDNGKKGYLFEVDLEYPNELHDLHNGYALCSENKIITNDMLNEFQKQDTKISKLITTFYDKERYGLNYRYLKLVLSLGLKLKKIHRVVEYEQLNFMEGYIMKNTNERAKAKNSFEKDFYKLMNNSVYGKTMENVRNRINFKLVSTEEKALNIRNTRRQYTIFSDSLVGVHLLKKEVKLNKPIFIGQNVLDESKYIMYNFHYNFMLEKFKRENIDLLFTDTDSLCYHIRNQDPYEIIKKNKSYFDLSEYPKDHPLYDATNKKVIGKFKDEAIGDGEIDYITEFVGLRSKLYAYKTLDKESKKCKGVKRSVVKKELTFQMYNDIRLNDNLEYINANGNVKQNVIRSYKHKLYTECVSKLALNPLDDKSWVCNNRTDTLTFGHYKISSQ
jgi:hypothetical protein